MSSRRLYGAALALALALVAAGCGYGLVGRTSTLPEDVQKIFIETLRNESTRAQIDQILTQAITSEFVTRQRFQVVSDRASSDAVLEGVVKSFRVRAVSFGSQGRAREYEISITAQMEFKRNNADGDVLWANPAYLFRESYELELDAVSFLDTEDAAMVEVAESFAETMVIDLLEGF